ncbi:cell cycle inhibitor Nif1 [Cordyceps fumosorosea ARSEF 2679]|uniref:Cell cycle inhibitor Nif1 n=1 Tax=Cordyceps fumosorosea (strain ARSEF 2679) TaxID=1081104 RepID=A0A162JE33_CORFA|nr:cell cycle inhibitor Nif1 [Cordyceps fumosorosea ARSEF 2679]OAA67592.1 cell cycle inhibitor Nif1 [Cordyceps fumosorosea ARSEF 2679]
MSDKRPNLLDLRSTSHTSAFSSASRPLRSPRLHIAGEAPPELSPLDAFALQSRILAKQLQNGDKDGNRVSRLPPLTLESPLVVQGRSEYFRSMAYDPPADAAHSPDDTNDSLGFKTEFEDAFEEAQRPVSMHPRMSRIQPNLDDAPPMPGAFPEKPRGRQHLNVDDNDGFFGARTRSPSPIQSDTQSQFERRSEKSPVRNIPGAFPSTQFAISPERPRPSFEDTGLVPPRPPFLSKRSSSIKSSPPASIDEDNASTPASSFHSTTARKLSSASSAFAAPGALPNSFQRSPSVASDCSGLPRPSFNFSRPLSRSGTPSFDFPSRQASSDSQPSFFLADDAHTPVSVHSEAFLDQQTDDNKGTGQSYIYSKFTLPRGKAVQRSEPPETYPLTPSTSHPRKLSCAPPSPPTRPSSSSARFMGDDASSFIARPSFDAGKASLDIARTGSAGYPSPNSSRPSIEVAARSEDAGRGRTLQFSLNDARGRMPTSTYTSDSAGTVRPPPTATSFSSSLPELTAEDHLEKGIQLHENGSLKESTYHLRLAAKQSNPTAMLLYALACRHGWGMRPSQREGVEWLRKAAEHASVEVADDQDQVKEGKHVNVLERRARKAQFALSIYELGVSHMNGWGIEQDKTLALRCFEIAGNWGDVDALAEAGFCYAQGVGCKKNLKKSAKFYKLAEAKGMSMVGNSWIHKAKYNDDTADVTPSKDPKKARSRSRARTMFGRKRSVD